MQLKVIYLCFFLKNIRCVKINFYNSLNYFFLGLCLEKIAPTSTSKYKLAEHTEQIMKCFELAADLTLLYLQELDKLQQQPPTTTSSSGNNSYVLLLFKSINFKLCTDCDIIIIFK